MLSAGNESDVILFKESDAMSGNDSRPLNLLANTIPGKPAHVGRPAVVVHGR
jgi:hypothetical protein